MIKNEINTNGLTKGKVFAYETLNNLQLTTKLVEKLNQIYELKGTTDDVSCQGGKRDVEN